MILKYSNKLSTILKTNSILKRCFKTSSDQAVFIERLDSANEQGIYILNLNRQSAKNALSNDLVNNLIENVQKLKTVNDLKVLIIASKVKGVFCAGADLKERLKMDENEIDPFVAKLRSIAYEIHQFPMVTIAAVDGVAVGGGLEMALACDLRICSSDAKLGLVETKLAILPGAFGTQLLPRIVGPSKAKELIFAARILSGHQAESIGLVNEVKEQNEDKTAAFLGSIDLAKQIIPNGPIALRAAKIAINDGIDANLKEGLNIERAAYRKVIPTKDRIEGLKAFIEKRKPIYKGE